jgi:hypothetical protein
LLSGQIFGPDRGEPVVRAPTFSVKIMKKLAKLLKCGFSHILRVNFINRNRACIWIDQNKKKEKKRKFGSILQFMGDL